MRNATNRRSKRAVGAMAGALGLCIALVGCDDGTVISHVERDVALDRSRILAMAAGDNNIPVEIHGVLWPDLAPEEVAAALRLPNRYPTSIRFKLVAPGSLDQDEDKLVLFFNAASPPRVRRGCTLAAGAPSEPPQNGPFRVTAVFCNGPDAMGSGALVASKQVSGDWPEFVRAMRVLFTQILDDFSGRSEP